MTTTALGRTFTVSDVSPATGPLPEVRYRRALEDFLGTRVEACSGGHKRLVGENRSHPLVGALHEAFASHRPVSLSPDIIWLTICQGLAHHVNANAERLRHRFVKHGGRLKLTVQRDSFVKGSSENDWPGVFGGISAAIRDHIGDAHRLIVADFSTTGPVERAASELVLIDAMHAYFSYEVVTICGIPAVTLEGTPDDWRSIARRVRAFDAFDLDWWIDPLLRVCNEFVRASEGSVDRDFWGSFYKWHGKEGSGSPYVTGWIQTLFPYVDNPVAKRAARWGSRVSAPALCRNPVLSGPHDDWPSGFLPGRDDFPCLPSKAPFEWRYFGRVFAMEFVGGLIGIAQDPETLCLRPEIGWAVRDAPAQTLC